MSRAPSLFFLLFTLFLSAGCSTSSTFTPTGNPLLDLRNPELLERDRIAAAQLAWGQVESGVRVRERTRKALKNLAWSNATTPELRFTVLELLMSDSSEEGQADSRMMARLILPTEHSPRAVRIISDRAVKSGWTELVPSLVRSYARQSPNVPDNERDERAAMLALRPNQSIEEIVFGVFLNPAEGVQDERAQAVLRLSQRTRDDAWSLLSRLDTSGHWRRQLVDSPRELDADKSSRRLMDDLRAAHQSFGVIPDTAMELQWLSNLRNHPDSRNAKLNSRWWSQTEAAMSGLDTTKRTGIRMHHLEPIRWVKANRPAWLSLDSEALYALVSQRMSNRTHHKRKGRKGEGPRRERLKDWRGQIQWADMISILAVDEAMANQAVVEQIFTQRTLDKKDSSTEYGGVVEEDTDTGFRAVLYRPRSRDRIDDQRFVASDDMFRFSDRSLVHYHMHVDKRDNGKYAGPSRADLINAHQSGRANLVFTSLGKHELNVDLYLPSGIVIDLGQIYKVSKD